MYLSSFVQNQDLPLLVKTLTQIYLGELHKTTSLLIITGQPNSGKTTLCRIIQGLYPQLVKLPFESLIENINQCYYPCSQMKYFKNDYVMTECERANHFAYLHASLNKSIIYRKMYHNFEEINKPATLIIEYTQNDPCDIGYDNLKRNPIHIFLPHQFNYGQDDEKLITQCVLEVKFIVDMFKIYSIWSSFYFVMTHLQLNDISTHLGLIIISYWRQFIPLELLINFYKLMGQTYVSKINC
jgi:hypothetical protein